MVDSKEFPESFDEIRKMFISDPIYSQYRFKKGDEINNIKQLLNDKSLDAFCVDCQKNSVFKISPSTYKTDELAEKSLKDGIFSITAKCTRDRDMDYGIVDCNGRMFFTFVIKDTFLVKAGQYPSKAALDFGSLDPVFNKELDPDLRAELGSAIGLHAYRVGVGSFVYLRRIFEKLIEEAHKEAEKQEIWDEAVYKQKRMPGKIKILENYLPSALVKRAELYGIISKGIHDLNEEECMSYFVIVKNGIEDILRERHMQKKYEKGEKEIKKLGSQLKTI